MVDDIERKPRSGSAPARKPRKASSIVEALSASDTVFLAESVDPKPSASSPPAHLSAHVPSSQADPKPAVEASVPGTGPAKAHSPKPSQADPKPAEVQPASTGISVEGADAATVKASVSGTGPPAAIGDPSSVDTAAPDQAQEEAKDGLLWVKIVSDESYHQDL